MRWFAVLGVLGLALAQSPRWMGQTEYRFIAGAQTSAGANLDRSYVQVFPSQGEFRGTLILVPGFLGGATSFEALARRLVLAAPGWEVWAWDRRANGLEDRKGFSTPDPWAYYQKYQMPEVAFLKDWGLRVHLEDLERVVDQARARGPVVLAGHSLGASLASLFALYRPEKISGLILLDGSPSLPRTSEQQYRQGSSTPFGYTAGLDGLLAGQADPYISALGLNPVGLAQAEAQAFMAAQNPQADAPAGWAKWPGSRMAAALSRIDDRYQPVAIFSVSVGRAIARESLNLIGLVLGSLAYTVRAPIGKRVEWADTGEPSDPLEFLELYAHPETGFSEWFFPYRLSLDMSAWDIAMPELKPRAVPYTVLALGAGRGLLPKAENFRELARMFPGSQSDVRILPDLTHLDILTSRRGVAVAPIAEYLKSIQ